MSGAAVRPTWGGIDTLTLDARAVDKFAHRGILAVAVKQERFQVQRITYDSRGRSTVVQCGDYVPFELLAANLNAEASFGALS